MQFNKVLDDMTFKVRTMADNDGMVALANKMAGYHKSVRESVQGKLKTQGVDELFEQMQRTYSSMQDEMGELLSVQRRAMRSDAPNTVYESYLKKLVARPGANSQAKEGFAAAIKTAEQYKSGLAQVFRDVQRNVRVNEAAIAFNPMIKPGLLGQTAATVAGGSTVMAAVSGAVNPAIPLGIGSMAVATSPRIAGNVAVLSNSMWAGKEWLARQNKQVLDSLLSNPAALNAFVNSVVQTPLVKDQVKSTLLQSNGLPVK
jgi:hypothetical protein